MTAFVNSLQESAEAVKDDITFTYKGGEYSFVNKFVDRNDKKISKMLTGVMFGCFSCEVPKEQWSDASRSKKKKPVRFCLYVLTCKCRVITFLLARALYSHRGRENLHPF